MLLAVLQFINDEERINDGQRSQFSSVVHLHRNSGILKRKDSTGKSGQYHSVRDVESGMAHKLTDFKLEFKYDE